MSFVANAPLKYNDPTGHIAWFVPLLIGAAIGASIAYGIQVANNYHNNGGDLGNAMTTNIDGMAILGGAIIGAAAVALAPAAATLAGEALVGLGLIASSPTLVGTGQQVIATTGELAGLVYGGSKSVAPASVPGSVAPGKTAANQVRTLTDLSTHNGQADTVEIGGFPAYRDAGIAKGHTYFEMNSDLYNANPALGQAANQQFMVDQMNTGKAFNITLNLTQRGPGQGLAMEMGMLNANPYYEGSFAERFYSPTWLDAIGLAGAPH